MNIVAISWVRNEADIIEAFVRHHCAFVDRMIIVNHRSGDATGSILEQLRREGLPLDLRSDDTIVHRQGEVMTALLRELRATDTNLVLPLDADEFVWTADGENPRSTLEYLARDRVTLLPWRTYVPLPEDDASECNVLQRIRHRKKREYPQWYKVAIPGALLQGNMILDIGSHALVYGETMENVVHDVSGALFLGHFPVRSAGQIAGKVFGGWLSHMANPQRMPGTIFQWKAIYDQVKSGATIDALTLKNMALEYATHKQWDALPKDMKGNRTLETFTGIQPEMEPVQDAVLEDPIRSSVETRYPFTRLTPMQTLAESAETLAQELADCRRKMDTADHGTARNRIGIESESPL